MLAPMNTWDPALYQDKHAFVWQYGQDLIGLLTPRPGERILDVGCGPGQLTAQIAAAGAEVTGIDSSPAMIAEARKNYPKLRFDLMDAARMPYDRQFHAVFSNAALHWVRDAGAAAAGMARALMPGGRLVVEFGGKGNVQQLQDAIFQAAKAFHLKIPENVWFYPGIGEYAGMLERHGLEVNFATLFDRPTALTGGLEDWIAMFRGSLLAGMPEERREAFVRQVEEYAKPALWRDGQWFADYRRLRITAKRV
jgi:trans-aconitate 2-methyltransferase